MTCTRRPQRTVAARIAVDRRCLRCYLLPKAAYSRAIDIRVQSCKLLALSSCSLLQHGNAATVQLCTPIIARLPISFQRTANSAEPIAPRRPSPVPKANILADRHLSCVACGRVRVAPCNIQTNSTVGSNAKSKSRGMQHPLLAACSTHCFRACAACQRCYVGPVSAVLGRQQMRWGALGWFCGGTA